MLNFVAAKIVIFYVNVSEKKILCYAPFFCTMFRIFARFFNQCANFL